MDQPITVDEDEEPNPDLNRITNMILGAAFAVHTQLGPGHQEHVYANALQIEFHRRQIQFVREARFLIKYAGAVVGEGRLDFIVEGKVIVELKAVETMTPLFTSQVISYLKATNVKLALLINFNVRSLREGIKRIAR